MDSELGREKGITIQNAAIFGNWDSTLPSSGEQKVCDQLSTRLVYSPVSETFFFLVPLAAHPRGRITHMSGQS